MGAEGKLMGRGCFRGQLDDDNPRSRDTLRAQEKAGARREVDAEVALGTWVPDGAWDGVSDFHEDDEPLEALLWITSRPPDGYTEPPPGWAGPVR